MHRVLDQIFQFHSLNLHETHRFSSYTHPLLETGLAVGKVANSPIWSRSQIQACVLPEPRLDVALFEYWEFSCWHSRYFFGNLIHILISDMFICLFIFFKDRRCIFEQKGP